MKSYTTAHILLDEQILAASSALDYKGSSERDHLLQRMKIENLTPLSLTVGDSGKWWDQVARASLAVQASLVARRTPILCWAAGMVQKSGRLLGSQNGLRMEGEKCDTVLDFGLGGWDGAKIRQTPWVTERPRYGGRKV